MAKEKEINNPDIFYCIEYSGITKERIKNKLIELHDRATEACKTGGIFEGKPVKEIQFYWFKNWLHPELKHRTATPRMCDYNLKDNAEFKEYNELLNRSIFENGQQNFSYTLEDIENYINEEGK